MGPTSRVPLPARDGAGKALGEMACGEASFNAPAGSDGRKRLEDEAALADLAVWNGEAARSKSTAAPNNKVEIEDARAPAPPGAPAEFSLDLFEAVEHFPGIEAALDEGDRVGEISTGTAVGRIEDDRRGVKQAELLVEPRDSCFDYPRRTAEAAVRPVRSNCDCVQVRCMPHGGSPRSGRCA